MIRIYDKILQSNQSTEVSLMKFYKKIDLLRVISYKCWKSGYSNRVELLYYDILLTTGKTLICNNLINKATNDLNLSVKY